MDKQIYKNMIAEQLDEISKLKEENEFLQKDSLSMLNRIKELSQKIKELETKSYFKDRNELLQLTMENAELKDKLINYGYPETDGCEVGSPDEYDINPQLNLFND